MQLAVSTCSSPQQHLDGIWPVVEAGQMKCGQVVHRLFEGKVALEPVVVHVLLPLLPPHPPGNLLPVISESEGLENKDIASC